MIWAPDELTRLLFWRAAKRSVVIGLAMYGAGDLAIRLFNFAVK